MRALSMHCSPAEAQHVVEGYHKSEGLQGLQLHGRHVGLICGADIAHIQLCLGDGCILQLRLRKAQATTSHPIHGVQAFS